MQFIFVIVWGLAPQSGLLLHQFLAVGIDVDATLDGTNDTAASEVVEYVAGLVERDRSLIDALNVVRVNFVAVATDVGYVRLELLTSYVVDYLYADVLHLVLKVRHDIVLPTVDNEVELVRIVERNVRHHLVKTKVLVGREGVELIIDVDVVVHITRVEQTVVVLRLFIISIFVRNETNDAVANRFVVTIVSKFGNSLRLDSLLLPEREVRFLVSIKRV